MKLRTTQAVLKAVKDTVSTVYPDVYTNKNYCINGTRIAIGVLKKFHVEARPIAVDAVAMNKVWWDNMVANKGWPKDSAMSDAWTEGGGWALAVGQMSPDNDPLNWSGHLVLTARGYVMDVSAGQMSRPQHKLTIPECVVFQMPDGWLDGKPAYFELDEGGVLSYKAVPENRGYVEAPGFTWTHDNRRIAKIVERKVRDKLLVVQGRG